MSAYVIFMRDKLRDAEEFAKYQEKGPAAAAGHPLKIHAHFGPHEVLEGPPVEGVAILEFPSVEAAHAWYHGPLYSEARRHRHLSADYRAIIVEGFNPAV